MAPEAVVLLQARMASTRLPGKALAPIGGVPVLTHCLQRLVASGVGRVLLATTTAPEDDALVEEAARVGVAAVRGSSFDVLGRFAQAVRQTRATFVVRATGDNPAVDIDAAGRTLDALFRSVADYCCERGLPAGGAVEAMRTRVLLDAAARATTDADREHVTTYIRRERGRYRVVEPDAPQAVRRPDLRLTVDTAADLAFMRAVADGLPGAALSRAPLAAIIAAADRVAAQERVA